MGFKTFTRYATLVRSKENKPTTFSLANIEPWKKYPSNKHYYSRNIRIFR